MTSLETTFFVIFVALMARSGLLTLNLSLLVLSAEDDRSGLRTVGDRTFLADPVGLKVLAVAEVALVVVDFLAGCRSGLVTDLFFVVVGSSSSALDFEALVRAEAKRGIRDLAVPPTGGC